MLGAPHSCVGLLGQNTVVLVLGVADEAGFIGETRVLGVSGFAVSRSKTLVRKDGDSGPQQS